MRIPDQTLNSVVFVGYLDQDNQPQWAGTAFVVSVPTPNPTFATLYLVTVQHVANKLAHRKWCVRFNTTDGKSRIAFGSPTVQIWKHPTEEKSVDAAVISWTQPKDSETLHVPVEMFVTDEAIADNGIGIGDEVFMIGLFRLHAGSDRNLPIVRTSNVVMMPKERLPAVKVCDNIVPAEAYLIEARSLGGISGSPVFVRETVTAFEEVTNKTTGEKQKKALFIPSHFYLLGMSHGHWNIYPDEHNRYDFKTTGAKEDSIALGISVVVPAKKILEILYRQELVEQRAELARQHLASRDATSSE